MKPSAAILEGPNSDAEYVALGAGARPFWTTGRRVVEFIEEMCVFSNGRWTGDPFVLLPWQKRLIYELFEVRPENGLRRYRRALIGVARKQGKTELAAALAMYLMLADNERSAQIYCAAGNEEQADAVFQAAKAMCEIEGAPLTELVKVEQGALTAISDPRSFFKRLSSKGDTKHGLNIHGAVFDELHVWNIGQGEKLWRALTTGSGARLQPLQIAITTAGEDKEQSRCWALYEYGRALERGELDDDAFYFRWWQAPDGCDYRVPEMWKLAMPSYGNTVSEEFLKGELAGTNVVGDQRQGAITEAMFRNLYLNQWVDYAETPWVTKEQLAPCRVEPFALVPGKAAWVGVDLSRSEDSTAVAWGQQWSDDSRPCGHRGEPCLYVDAKAWERPRGADGRLLDGWMVPLDDVRQHIRDLNASYRVLTNVFDPYGSQLMRLDLEGEGLLCELMYQQGQRRSAAAAGLYDLIAQGRLHYSNESIERHLLNATVKKTGDDGYYLQKRSKGRVMDIAQALSQVVYGTLYEHDEGDGIVVYVAKPREAK